MSTRAAFTGILFGLASAGTLGQQVYEAKPFAQEFSGGRRALIQVYGGKPVPPGRYPASFQAGRVGHRCTWFLVSSGTLVGAAHCVIGNTPADPLAQIKLPIAGIDHIASCEISGGYWQDSSEDWALCHVAPPAPVPDGPDVEVSGFEVIDRNPKSIRVNTQLEIMGYGCYADNGLVEKDLLMGTAIVQSLPPSAAVAGATGPTVNAVTLGADPQLLCEGDSGGPAFRYTGFGGTYRLVVGINSSTAIRAGVSYLASVSTDSARAFFENWADRHGERICGLHDDASDCRPIP